MVEHLPIRSDCRRLDFVSWYAFRDAKWFPLYIMQRVFNKKTRMCSMFTSSLANRIDWHLLASRRFFMLLRTYPSPSDCFFLLFAFVCPGLPWTVSFWIAENTKCPPCPTPVHWVTAVIDCSPAQMTPFPVYLIHWWTIRETSLVECTVRWQWIFPVLSWICQ